MSSFRSENFALLTLGDCLHSSATFVAAGLFVIISLVLAVRARLLLAIGDSVVLRIISKFQLQKFRTHRAVCPPVHWLCVEQHLLSIGVALHVIVTNFMSSGLLSTSLSSILCRRGCSPRHCHQFYVVGVALHVVVINFMSLGLLSTSLSSILCRRGCSPRRCHQFYVVGVALHVVVINFMSSGLLSTSLSSILCRRGCSPRRCHQFYVVGVALHVVVTDFMSSGLLFTSGSSTVRRTSGYELHVIVLGHHL